MGISRKFLMKYPLSLSIIDIPPQTPSPRPPVPALAAALAGFDPPGSFAWAASRIPASPTISSHTSPSSAAFSNLPFLPYFPETEKKIGCCWRPSTSTSYLFLILYLYLYLYLCDGSSQERNSFVTGGFGKYFGRNCGGLFA